MEVFQRNTIHYLQSSRINDFSVHIMKSMIKYDVFISSKSEDYALAQEIFEFLVSKGINVFFADTQLKQLGTSDYSDVIDNVIDNITHMIVVGSTKEHIESKWVKAEWRAFTDEQRAGRKNGNILTILDGVIPAELPLALRNVQSFNKNNYKNNILQYLTSGNTLPQNRLPKTVNDIQLFFEKGPRCYIPKILLIMLLSIISTLFLSITCINESEICYYMKEKMDVEAKNALNNKLDSLDINIKYLAGQMDSAYNVARRLSAVLEENPISELTPMEEGTLEYNSSDKSKYTLCLYYELTDVDSMLIEYVHCIRLYNEDFEKIDSLIDIKDKASKKGAYNFYEYNDGIIEQAKALLSLSSIYPMVLLQQIGVLLLFITLFFILYCIFDKRSSIHRTVKEYFGNE